MEYGENFLRGFVPDISDKSLQLLVENAEEITLKKGSIFAQENEIPEHFYVVLSGIARGYIIDKNGKERIITLYLPPCTCGPLASLIEKTPSKKVYDCITDCVMLKFNYHTFRKQAETNVELAQLNIKVLERIFMRTNNKANELSVLNATERYLNLKEIEPNIDNLIQQYHIASYLNITPVQLSRIRKKLYSKSNS